MPSDALKSAVIELLKVEFSALRLAIEPDDDCFVKIQPAWKEFGPVEIVEDHGQLIVNWGRFTHSHIDSYDEVQEERIRDIVDSLRHLLINVISEKVAFWGQSRGGSGGFYSLDHVRSLKCQQPAYLWSGKELDNPIQRLSAPDREGN